MRSFFFLLTYIFCFSNVAYCQPPANDNIKTPKELHSLTGYCSSDAEYSNIGATASGYKKASFWNSEGKDVWFKFKAVRTDINISVTGKTSVSSTNTLINPLIAIYTYDGSRLTEMIGSMVTSNHLTTAYKGGLTVGDDYYIRISAENDQTGTFKLCINNYSPVNKPGQDCETASFLCSKETISEVNITGAGINSRETAGTCLGTESNSAWYKWIADDNGTLTFSITPTSVTDDIDFVLYDLGVNGDCSGVTAANAIRCAAGNGINCTPSYYITGLNLTSVDVSEEKNCPPGQDGWLKYVDMIKGHTYALIINNFSNGNNGFTLSFGGTGTFKGPKTEIEVVKNNLCSTQQNYIFSPLNQNSDVHLKWNFGEGSSLGTVTGPGPHTVVYQSEGLKTISLEATSGRECAVFTYYYLNVALKPVKPIISASKIRLCINDILTLNTATVEGGLYYWTGPNNFISNEQNPEIKITGSENSGDYKLIVKVGECESEQSILTIPFIPRKPVAAFTTDPILTLKYAAPISIHFINSSKNATSFHWDFGDGESSSELNPHHTYNDEGNYIISLRAISENGCFSETYNANLVLLKAGPLFIPNAFSPNGDGINDEFKINIPNLRNYQLMIFNRWGTKVFETTDIFKNWDGKHNNQDLPVGAYYYMINAKDLESKVVKHSGTITLIR